MIGMLPFSPLDFFQRVTSNQIVTRIVTPRRAFIYKGLAYTG
jgi:hypothetical protein